MRRLMDPVMCFVFSLAIVFTVPAAGQIQIFSTGQFGTPETITLAPSGFGGFGGSYFVTDAVAPNFWVVPNLGGPPVSFPAAGARGGLFLPPGWSTNSGKFLVTTVATGPLSVYDSDGSTTPFDPLAETFVTPLIAPAGFGAYGGNLFVSSDPQSGPPIERRIWRADPSSGLTLFTDLTSGPFKDSLPDPFITCPFGLEFTPADFGSFGSLLLVSDACGSGDIAAIDSNGSASKFTIVPLAPSQGGLRQLLMAPKDYFLDSLGRGTADGNFSPDAKDVAPGTLRLRSERKEDGDGRVYLVVVKATDGLGYVAGACGSVVVPRSQSRADQASVEARAAAATSFCRTRAFSAPAGFFKVGDGPVLGPKQ